MESSSSFFALHSSYSRSLQFLVLRSFAAGVVFCFLGAKSASGFVGCDGSRDVKPETMSLFFPLFRLTASVFVAIFVFSGLVSGVVSVSSAPGRRRSLSDATVLGFGDDSRSGVDSFPLFSLDDVELVETLGADARV